MSQDDTGKTQRLSRVLDAIHRGLATFLNDALAIGGELSFDKMPENWSEITRSDDAKEAEGLLRELGLDATADRLWGYHVYLVDQTMISFESRSGPDEEQRCVQADRLETIIGRATKMRDLIESVRAGLVSVRPGKGENMSNDGSNQLSKQVQERSKNIAMNSEVVMSSSMAESDDAAQAADVHIPERARKAGEQYSQAADALGNDHPTDREAYDKIAEAYEGKRRATELPTFATWTRNLRTWRQATGQQRNKSRRGRLEQSGSVVGQSEL